MKQVVQHAARVAGVLKVPGDKSISHRALILAAIATGKQVVEGLPAADDVASTAACMRSLGCFVEEMPDGRTIVLTNELAGEARLDAGNSGTTARLLIGLTAGAGIDCTIDGDASLRARPMARVAEPIAMMGARVVLGSGGGLPATIRGGGLHGIHYRLPVASAQVKSAVLIAGLQARGETTVVEPVPTRDHTERMLAVMGANIQRDGDAVTVTGGEKLRATHINVPGDFSSAAFFLVAATCLPDSELFLPTTGINPTRTGLLNVLREMSANIVIENKEEMSGEPVGDVAVASAQLTGITLDDPTMVASVIDEIPVLAVAATQAEGETVVRGASELRRKECDRIKATVANLTALGAQIEEYPDGFRIVGPSRLRGATVDSHGDHRMAMAMAVAGLLADGETEIVDADSVDISYPRFFQDLKTVVR